MPLTNISRLELELNQLPTQAIIIITSDNFAFIPQQVLQALELSQYLPTCPAHQKMLHQTESVGTVMTNNANGMFSKYPCFLTYPLCYWAVPLTYNLVSIAIPHIKCTWHFRIVCNTCIWWYNKYKYMSPFLLHVQQMRAQPFRKVLHLIYSLPNRQRTFHAANFSESKSGHYIYTNQSCHEYPLGAALSMKHGLLLNSTWGWFKWLRSLKSYGIYYIAWLLVSSLYLSRKDVFV